MRKKSKLPGDNEAPVFFPLTENTSHQENPTAFDKATLSKIIAKQVTATYKVLEIGNLIGAYSYVMLLDMDANPPLSVVVELTPKYMAQAQQWTDGTIIQATIKSTISTFAEKVEEYGWNKEMGERLLKEAGYSWDSAWLMYYFVGKITNRQSQTAQKREKLQ